MSGQSWWQRVPWSIVICSAGLVTLGLAGIARADELSAGTDRLPRQITWVTFALPLCALAAAIPYRRIRPYSYLLLGVSIPLLVLTYFMPARNGARCWIPLGPFDLQPSELAKLGLILALAYYLMHRDHFRSLWGLIPPFLVTLVPLGLILKEPDLGSAMLLPPILMAMLLAAGARLRHLLLVVTVAVMLLPVFWMGMNAEQRSRITSLLAQQDGGPAPRGDGYHQHQSKLMLALGGPLGSDLAGVTTDDPDAYHLPAGQTDFVFCLVGERFGLWGCLLTLALYALLFGRALWIAGATREPFGRLVAVGIVAMLASQTAINTGMTVGLMPIAGITLPLMSYGGSSLLATAVALGLLINVAMRPGYELTAEPFQFARSTG